MPDPRPDNREVENENLHPASTQDGPPRPSTEPPGSKGSSQNPALETDPGTGAPSPS